MMTNADRRMILLRVNILYASPPDLKPGNADDDASHEYAKRAWEYFQRKQQQQQKEQKNSTCSATNIRFGTIAMGQLTYMDPQISTTETPTATTTTSVPGLPPYCGMIVEETYGREHADAIASSSSSSNDASSSSSPQSTSTSSMIQDINLMLLSCTADGSVNRSVRKILRALSKEKKSPATAAATARGTATTIHTSTTATADDLQPPQQQAIVVDQTHKTHTITITGCGLLGHARCDNSAKQMAETIFQSGRKFEKQVSAYGGGNHATMTNHMPSRILPRLETQVELIGPEVEFDPWLATILTNVLEASR